MECQHCMDDGITRKYMYYTSTVGRFLCILLPQQNVHQRIERRLWQAQIINRLTLDKANRTNLSWSSEGLYILIVAKVRKMFHCEAGRRTHNGNSGCSNNERCPSVITRREPNCTPDRQRRQRIRWHGHPNTISSLMYTRIDNSNLQLCLPACEAETGDDSWLSNGVSPAIAN